MALHWLLLRVRWRRALAPSLVAALLIGAIGGFVLAAAAAANRVEDSYRSFVGKIDAPDVAVIPAIECGDWVGSQCEGPSGSARDAHDVIADLNGLTVVEDVRLVESIIPFIVDAEGIPIFGTVDDVNACYDGDSSVQMVAVAPGGPTDQVVPFTLDGELPSPGSGTVVFTRNSAETVGLAIGDHVLLAGYCSSDDDGAPVEFAVPVDLRISGLSIGPLDLETPEGGLTIHPAYVDPLAFDAMTEFLAEPQQNIAVWLDPTASEQEVAAELSAYSIIIDFRERQTAFDEALATDANLLWLLAAVGGLGGLLVLAPVIGRSIRDFGPRTETLTALGMRRPQVAHQAIVHSGSLALVGALTAAIVAVPISAFLPRGLAAAIHPHREFWFDGVLTIVGVGVLAIVVVVGASLPAFRLGRAHSPETGGTERAGRVIGLFRSSPAARTGVSAAIGSSAGPRRASPWPTLVSMMVAVAVGTASLTYLAGLRYLEETPQLVGWNWDAVVSFDFDQGDPGRAVEILAEIAALDVVDKVTGGTFYPPSFLFVPDGETFVWPWSFDTGPEAIGPSIVSGRAPEGPDEVAITAVFASENSAGIGDTVMLGRASLVALLDERLSGFADEEGLAYEGGDTSDHPPIIAAFEVTGIAVTPSDPSLDGGEVTLTLGGYAALVEPGPDEVAAARAWLPDDLPAELADGAEELFANLEIRDRVGYVSFAGDVDAGVEAILAIEGAPEVVAPTAEQVLTLMVGLNLDRSDRVPVALAIMVAVALVALVAYLLVFAIRARRFEVAVMRSVGLSTNGVRWSVAAQATATALVALMLALPVGILVGRWAWLEYARDLDVVPVSVVPWSSLVWIVVAAIALANAVALLPGWFATRRSVGADLRSE